MFLHRYFYKFLSLLAFCYYFFITNIWTSLVCVLNPFKFNKNLHNEIVNNKSTLFLTLINNWKKPNHLVLIIGEDVILYNDITQIILWCMIAGISFVSIYDYKNRLSHYELARALRNNKIIEEINKLTFGFSFNTLNNNTIVPDTVLFDASIKTGSVETNGISKYCTNGIEHLSIIEENKTHRDLNMKNKPLEKYGLHENGCFVKGSSEQLIYFNGNEKFDLNNNEKTVLNILTRKQCENDVLSSIVELSKTDNNINSAIIQHILDSKCPLPDPEVAIVIGRKLSSYGLLPWNIRLTEFFQFNNYYDISLCKFKNILMKYSKCEQRYGK